MTDPHDLARDLVRETFAPAASGPASTGRPSPLAGPASFVVVALEDANLGRGTFSDVLRVRLRWRASHTGPSSVVVKMPAEGPNGLAAVASGACRREATAYRSVLPRSPIPYPRPYLVRTVGDEAWFVLQDLGDHRAVDQLDGLSIEESVSVAVELRRFHLCWLDNPQRDELDVRRATPSTLDPSALATGLEVLRARWASHLDREHERAFERLLANRGPLVDAFASAGPPTLCHGDPRADNLVFAADGRAVLFDWQQLAVQFGPADLAWLAATSLTPDVRRQAEAELMSTLETTVDAYRLGLVLPGLAVLLLCQRESDDERTNRFIATSLLRIGTALVDLDVAGAA